MNLYTAADHAKAETVLATAWAKSAAADRRTRRFQDFSPRMPTNINHGRGVPKIGAAQAVRNYIAGVSGTFTITDIRKALPNLTAPQVSSALGNVATEGIFEVIGKTPMGVNIYRRVALMEAGE